MITGRADEEGVGPAPPGASTGGGRRLSLLRVSLAVAVVVGLTVGGVAGVRRATRTTTAPAETWYAPYVDVTLTPQLRFEDPATTAVDDLVLAFVVADDDDGCTPSWGGAYGLDAAATSLDLDRRIARYRERGGDVVVSFGGIANDELARTCTDEDRLAEAYRSVVERYDVTTIDLDIEGDALADTAANARRARAVARVQRAARRHGRPLSVWLTLPVTPTGLLADGTAVVDGVLAADVDLGGVNVMTMNYGSTRPPATPVAEATEQALRATHRQLGAAYRRAGTRLDDRQLWGKLGATPMIGRNDEPTDVFEPDDARALRALALHEGLGRVSVWSANRDEACPTSGRRGVSDHCSGVTQAAGTFSRILDVLAGRPGAAASRRTTADPRPPLVDDPKRSPYPVWSSGTVYDTGDKVVRRGAVYAAKWWNRGDDPDAPVADEWSTPWRLVGPVLATDRPAPTTTVAPGTFPAWDPAVAYAAGDRVLAGGVGYEARWWTRGDQPGGPVDDAGQTPWDPIASP